MHTREKIHTFLDISDSIASRSFRWILVVCIIVSSLVAILQLLKVGFIFEYSDIIWVFEKGILIIFTWELLLRVYVAGSFRDYLSRSINWIDILWVVPFYFGISNTTVLRLFRVLRIMKFKRSNLADFFDKPSTKLSLWVRFCIIWLILLSSWIALIQINCVSNIFCRVFYKIFCFKITFFIFFKTIQLDRFSCNCTVLFWYKRCSDTQDL